MYDVSKPVLTECYWAECLHKCAYKKYGNESLSLLAFCSVMGHKSKITVLLVIRDHTLVSFGTFQKAAGNGVEGNARFSVCIYA